MLVFLDSTFLVLSIMVGIIAVCIIALAVASRIIFKMAARNFSRRKAQSVIVIMGLMIGTAIISSALVVEDTMVNLFELTSYRSYGEIDEEIWGPNMYGSVSETADRSLRYFSESIYESLVDNLSSNSYVEAVAPVISDMGSVLDLDSNLSEPAVALLGLDSAVLRNTVFGDLDEKGFYPDSLGVGEAAINSRLRDELDAKIGHEIQLSFAKKDAKQPLGVVLVKTKFTVAEIIDEKEINGKANYNQKKSMFFELDVLQNMLNRSGEINTIWISNNGDYREGELYTDKVSSNIQDVLDDALGMNDMGLTMQNFDGHLAMMSMQGSFPVDFTDQLLNLTKQNNGVYFQRLMIPTVSIGNIPVFNQLIMGTESNDINFHSLEKDVIYIEYNDATSWGITSNTTIDISSISIDGTVRTTPVKAVILPQEFVSPFTDPMGLMTFGYVNLATGQTMLHGGVYQTDVISDVFVYGMDNNTLDSIQTAVENDLDERIGGKELNLEVHNVKADSLEVGREGGEMIGTMFMIFGMFSIIAGMVLIVNIFVMLGEERKSEMGMARAVGMKGKHLVRMFVFEGSIYAFIAAFVGAMLGLVFGKGLIVAFDVIFSSINETAGQELDIPFYFQWDSVFIAFSIGLVITFLTIVVVCTRITKLNIIRAIRRIPEPVTKSTKKKALILGGLMIILGFFTLMSAIVNLDGAMYITAVGLIPLGGAIVAHKWISFRSAVTIAGLIILFINFMPYEPPVVRDMSFEGMQAFVLSGVFLVLAGVLIVMFNSHLLLGALQKVFGRRKSTRAVLKTAISYPMDSKFKTGMTLGMFSLIIFTVTVIAMISAMQASTGENMLKEQSGGYDIIGFTNPQTPFVNVTEDTLPSELGHIDVEHFEIISQAVITVVDYDRSEAPTVAYGPPVTSVATNRYNLLGVSNQFLENNKYTLMERDNQYATDEDAWAALATNSSLCIVDGSKLEFAGLQMGPHVETSGVILGGIINITDVIGQDRTRELKVIGIMDQMFFFQGIIVKKEIVTSEYGGSDSIIMVDLAEDEDPDRGAKDFEKVFLDQGLQTLDMKGFINILLTLSNNMMYLMEGFLGIGLLVGIAGIGIISYRNVVERRQQIGMLRAIGFKKGMITKSFLIETSFVTILAILIGVLLGIGIGLNIYRDSGFGDQGVSFVIPWLNILAIVIFAYIATLIFTIYPSIKAARIPPAEALRYIE